MEDLKKLIRNHPMSLRWKKISKYLQQNEKNVDGLFICDGEDDLDSIKIKILAVQSYLFRFEFINSVMVILPTKMIFFSTLQKIVLMKEYKLDPDQKIEHIIFSGKGPIEVDFNRFFEVLRHENVRRLGYFEKEKPTGILGDIFMNRVRHMVGLVDMSVEVQIYLSVKDIEDLNLVRGSALLTCIFFKKFVEDIEEIIDSGEPKLHSVISRQLDNFMEQNKQKPNKWNLNGQFYDFAYTPIIQSNSSYSLKLTSKNSDEPLSSDCIILNLCGKYYEMNCLVVRTLLVNPWPNDKRNYQALLYLHKKILNQLRPGETLMEVFYRSRESFLKRFPELEDHLPSSFGFGIGFEYKERYLSINPKNPAIVRCNQVYAVVTSLRDLIGFKSKKCYSMQLADTIIIQSDQNQIVTEKVPFNIEEIGYDFADDAEREQSLGVGQTQEHDNYMRNKMIILEEKAKELSGKRITRAALKREKIQKETEQQQKRDDHQRVLLEEKMKELRERYENGDFSDYKNKEEAIAVEEIQVYSPSSYPSNLKTGEVRTDAKNWALLLPIHDVIVPMHISLLKSVVRQSNGELSHIRFNFYHPGVAVNHLSFPSSNTLPNDTIYLQELVYRTQQHDSALSLTTRIKELRKKWLNRGVLKDSVSQMDLGTKLEVLHELKMRPSLGGKKMKGNLTAYTNGYRFITKKNDVVQILHSNIKHAVFQPCNDTMMIFIHFHLFKPMLINKKKVINVQFYCEVIALAEDLTNNKRNRINNSYPEEVLEQDTDHLLQNQYDEAFLNFVERVNEKASISVKFESPYLDQSFYGSPFHNNVLISPCDTCLIAIVESPLFVLSIEDIEIVSIERVDNTLKNFDMVIIFRDYSRSVQTISNIPKKQLEMIRNWLDEKNILFFEGGGINLKWDNILKKIRENIKEFIFENGAWRDFFEDDEHNENSDVGLESESSFNEEHLEEDEDEAYKDDDYLEDMDQDGDDYVSDFDDMSMSPRPKKKSKRGRKRGRRSAS
jgi:nucleosome binding factor SPN SPT16 subunit